MGLIKLLSLWAIPFLLLLIPTVGIFKGIKVYESFVKGAEEGLNVAIKIIPFMVGMLVAISIFRESGALNYCVLFLKPLLNTLHIPEEVLTLAIMRPLSGGASLGIATDLIKTYGPDSFIGRLASTMQGSTDTTFYIITVYFGSVGIRKYKYAITLGLIADLTTLIASIFIVKLLF